MEIKWGVRSEYNFNADKSKNYFAFTLQPTQDKFYRLQLVDDHRGTIKTTRVETTDGGVVTDQSVRETTDALKVSLEFARRYGPFTGRVGLIESTGGFGGDLQFLDDKITLSTDFYDFVAEENPRIKSWMGWTIVPHLTLVGGVDDYINKETRDFFAGVYLHFTDNDLKAVFATSPSVSF